MLLKELENVLRGTEIVISLRNGNGEIEKIDTSVYKLQEMNNLFLNAEVLRIYLKDSFQEKTEIFIKIY